MKIRTIIPAALAMLALVSCDKLFVGDRTGKPVTFSASSDVPAGTKTAYSGEVIDGKERINWVDKDPVRMILYTHRDQYDRNPIETDTKTYYVVDIHEEGQKSVGKVASAGAFLTWRENVMHDFYSIYPGNYIGSTNISGYTREINLTLPSAQHGDIATNMRYAYMAAIHEGYTTAGKGSVVLDYYPMVTTVYITLNNATQKAMTIRSVRIKSNSGQALVGTYTISSDGTSPFAPQGGQSATAPEVSVVLDNATLQPGESTTCVIFLMPNKTYNTSDLTLTIVTNGGISDLSMENSAVSQFDPCKKYNLSFNVEERPIQYNDLTQVMNNLCILSNSLISSHFVFLHYKTPPGLYYNQNYKQGTWPDYPDGYIPVSDEDLQAALQEVTTISNTNDHSMDWMLANITPADFAIFPNLQSIDLSVSNNSNSFSVADLSNIIQLMYAGTASSLSVANCSFNPENAQPLVIKATSDEMKSISLTNISGLHEIVLQGGENGGGGQIGNVFIQNCPDLKTIRIEKSSGDIKMEKAVFDNLESIETIYIERANFTKELEVNDCPSLVRFIVCNQGNWELKRISLNNCPVLGDAAVDNSEYGLTGFNIEKVNEEFTAWKYNCPNLSATFNTYNKYGATTITFRE
ncbi:MAG: hypothetical protein SPK76_03580 [Bacteroidales bacterium]|nr:hypothetical protein [Bacteroidales bacterium]MDY6444093.1 hypothetical protein [Bacteroidales bacterium]